MKNITKMLLFGLGIFSLSSQANTIQVACTADNPDKVLTSAISAASPGDTLNVSGTCYGEFNINKSLTIQQDPSVNTVAVLDLGGGLAKKYFGSVVNIFAALSTNNTLVGVNVIFNGLTIQNGNCNGSGGGLTFYCGGGISNKDPINTVTLMNSTVSKNTTNSNGGGIYNYGNLTIINSTIANNTSSPAVLAGFGGGIYNDGTLTLNNSTVSQNQGSSGIDNSQHATLNIASNIIAGNAGRDLTNVGSIHSLGFNVIGTDYLLGQNNAPPAPTDIILGATSSGLDPLDYYGGTTQTMRLIPYSPAIGISSICTATDQRGVARKTPKCDAGAFESVPPTFAVVPNIQVPVTSSAGAIVSYSLPTATPAPITGFGSFVNSIVAESCDPPSGSLVPFFSPSSSIQVKCSAKDQFGYVGETTFIVDLVKASPRIVANLSPSGPVPLGSLVQGQAVLSNSTTDASGQVTYAVYSDIACTKQLANATLVPSFVLNGVIPASIPTPLNNAGTYYWQAAYSGDAFNNAATSDCASGAISVNASVPNTPAILLNPIPPVQVGVPFTPQAVLTGVTPTASGNATFAVFSDSVCSIIVIPDTPTSHAVVNGVVPPALPITLNTPGEYFLQARYSGDTANAGAKSVCLPFEAVLNSPALADPNLVVNPGPPALVGTPVVVAAVLENATPDATGSIIFKYFADDICTLAQPGIASSIQAVSGGVAPSSAPVLPIAAGTIFVKATYSGDSKNNPATSSCAPIKTISVTNPSVVGVSLTVLAAARSGSSGSVQAVLTNATFDASGTISYDVFSDSACSKNGVSATPNPNTVTNAAAPASISVPVTQGTVYWQATYSGDGKNLGVTSQCLQVTVAVATSGCDSTGYGLSSDGPILLLLLGTLVGLRRSRHRARRI